MEATVLANRKFCTNTIFDLVRNRCIRGSRVLTKRISNKIGWEDGAGLGLYVYAGK